MFLVTRKEERKISSKSRADYFRERRKKTSAFYAEVDTKQLEKLEEKLTEQNKSKKQWLNERIEEELKN